MEILYSVPLLLPDRRILLAFFPNPHGRWCSDSAGWSWEDSHARVVWRQAGWINRVKGDHALHGQLFRVAIHAG